MPKSKSYRQRRIIELSREIAHLSALLSNLILEEANDTNQVKEEELEVFHDTTSELTETDNRATDHPAPSAPSLPSPVARSSTPVQAVIVTKEEVLSPGDLVVITNNYQGRRGQQGYIVGTTTHQVTLRLRNSGLVVTKYKRNVRKVD